MTLTKNNKYYNKNKTCKNRKGGNVIGRGGYGCVFYPALKCKNKKILWKKIIEKPITPPYNFNPVIKKINSP